MLQQSGNEIWGWIIAYPGSLYPRRFAVRLICACIGLVGKQTRKRRWITACPKHWHFQPERAPRVLLAMRPKVWRVLEWVPWSSKRECGHGDATICITSVDWRTNCSINVRFCCKSNDGLSSLMSSESTKFRYVCMGRVSSSTVIACSESRSCSIFIVANSPNTCQ